MRAKQFIFSIMFLVVTIMFLAVSLADAGRVSGYYRGDGTYVQPYFRTNHDGNPYNNYSFPGNYNPNTGRTTPGAPNRYLDRYYDRSNQSPYATPRNYYPGR